jgi:hypothetical protein
MPHTEAGRFPIMSNNNSTNQIINKYQVPGIENGIIKAFNIAPTPAFKPFVPEDLSNVEIIEDDNRHYIGDTVHYLSQCVCQYAKDDEFRSLTSRNIPFALVDMENRVDEIIEELVPHHEELTLRTKCGWSTKGAEWEIQLLNWELDRLNKSLDNWTYDTPEEPEYECPTEKEAVYQYIIDSVDKMSVDKLITMLTFLADFDMNLKEKLECQVLISKRLVDQAKVKPNTPKYLARQIESRSGWQAVYDSFNRAFEKCNKNFIKCDVPESSVYNMDLESAIDLMSYAKRVAGLNATQDDILYVIEHMLDSR